MNPLLSILLKLTVVFAIGLGLIILGCIGLARATVPSEWRPELANGKLRYVNGKTAEILTPEEYAKRCPAAFQTFRRGGDWC